MICFENKLLKILNIHFTYLVKIIFLVQILIRLLEVSDYTAANGTWGDRVCVKAQLFLNLDQFEILSWASPASNCNLVQPNTNTILNTKHLH